MNPARSSWKREQASWASRGAWVTRAGHLLAAGPKEVARHSGFACKRKSLRLAQFYLFFFFNKNRQALLRLGFTAGHCRRHPGASDLPSWSVGVCKLQTFSERRRLPEAVTSRGPARATTRSRPWAAPHSPPLHPAPGAGRTLIGGAPAGLDARRLQTVRRLYRKFQKGFLCTDPGSPRRPPGAGERVPFEALNPAKV